MTELNSWLDFDSSLPFNSHSPFPIFTEADTMFPSHFTFDYGTDWHSFDYECGSDRVLDKLDRMENLYEVDPSRMTGQNRKKWTVEGREANSRPSSFQDCQLHYFISMKLRDPKSFTNMFKLSPEDFDSLLEGNFAIHLN